MREPIALSSPRDIGTDYPAVAFQGMRQKIEVSRVPRQSMHTHHNVRIVILSPIVVADGVVAVRSEAEDAIGSQSCSFLNFESCEFYPKGLNEERIRTKIVPY